MAKKKEIIKKNELTAVPLPDDDLMRLADLIVEEIEAGKKQLAISINEITKSTYWKVGRHIVEFEQHGHVRAKYGTSLLSRLAKILRAKVGKGYSRSNLNNMRNFYLMFPICQTSDKSHEGQICQTSDKLTWSHICELITIDDPLEREFYQNECIWSSSQDMEKRADCWKRTEGNRWP